MSKHIYSLFSYSTYRTVGLSIYNHNINTRWRFTHFWFWVYSDMTIAIKVCTYLCMSVSFAYVWNVVDNWVVCTSTLMSHNKALHLYGIYIPCTDACKWFIPTKLIQRLCHWPLIIDNSWIIINVGHLECMNSDSHNSQILILMLQQIFAG